MKELTNSFDGHPASQAGRQCQRSRIIPTNFPFILGGIIEANFRLDRVCALFKPAFPLEIANTVCSTARDFSSECDMNRGTLCE